jgi:hypothetical protein
MGGGSILPHSRVAGFRKCCEHQKGVF